MSSLNIRETILDLEATVTNPNPGPIPEICCMVQSMSNGESNKNPKKYRMGCVSNHPAPVRESGTLLVRNGWFSMFDCLPCTSGFLQLPCRYLVEHVLLISLVLGPFQLLSFHCKPHSNQVSLVITQFSKKHEFPPDGQMHKLRINSSYEGKLPMGWEPEVRISAVG